MFLLMEGAIRQDVKLIECMDGRSKKVKDIYSSINTCHNDMFHNLLVPHMVYGDFKTLY
jgi:hypothetical protein